jgi:ParB family chromosome partitioning protein
MVRPKDEGSYEIISGHRRVLACKKAGIERIPAFIRPMSRDEAVVCMVDSNLHRERLLPSERAFAYKMKVEALSHQGRASVRVGQKSTRALVAESVGESETQVQRYIRLTKLEKPLLELVDEGRIALSPAVEISHLLPGEQKVLIDIYEVEEITPSYSQAVRMRKLSKAGLLSPEKIAEILGEAKANQREFFKLPMERCDRYLSRFSNPKAREEFVLKALEYYTRYLERQRSRDAR